jgi:hypothetical protein
MTEVHSCSYYCNRPECIKAQRDELRERLAQPEQEPSSVQQAYAMAQVCLDLHEAIGCRWGDNPYLVIAAMLEAQRKWVGLTDEEKAVLRECRERAMKWTVQGRIPECGAFGEIAQDLDWLCDKLAAHGIKGEA